MIAIYCAGSLGQEVLDVLIFDLKSNPKEIVFIDDVISDTYIKGIKKYTYDEFLEKFDKDDVDVLISNGEPRYRKELFDKVKADGYSITSLISEKAFIGSNVHIDEGCIVFPFVYVGFSAKLEENVVLHVGSKVETNCTVKAHSFVSLGSFVGAGAIIEEQCFIGPNSTIRDKIVIGSNSVVGMGSTVICDLDERGVYVGNPTRRIRDNNGRVFES